MRRALLARLSLLLLLSACGAPADRRVDDRARDSGGESISADGAGGPAMEMDEAAGSARAVQPAIRVVELQGGLEPRVDRRLPYEPPPSQPAQVRLSRMNLGAGGSFRPPSGPCQDVLLYVRSGELRAVGAGIAPAAAPATLYAGDAIRFGPEGDGLAQNVGETEAQTLVAYVRPASAGEPDLYAAGPSSGEGCNVARADDPLVHTMRAASARTTPASEAFGGQLEVRVLLDEPGAGARFGGLSVLSGAAGLTVPQHQHPESAEILFIEDGSGVMQVGEREVAVRPGVAIYVPPGVLHDFRGDGSRPIRAIQIYTPAGPEQRFAR